MIFLQLFLDFSVLKDCNKKMGLPFWDSPCRLWTGFSYGINQLKSFIRSLFFSSCSTTSCRCLKWGESIPYLSSVA